MVEEEYKKTIQKLQESTFKMIDEKNERITELEKRCNELFFQVNEKTERIAELEKENTYLRLNVESTRCAGIELLSDKRKQLIKAKVILRNVIDYLGQFCSDYPDCVIEAEQFISEMEK